MKKIFLLPFVCIVFLPLLGAAQENAPVVMNRNFFYVSPVDLFLNTLELGYERVLPSKNCLYVAGAYRLSKKDNYYDHMGGGGELQYRVNLHYKDQGAMTGRRNFSTFAYFAPYLNYRYEQITYAISGYGLSQTTSYSAINSGFGGVGFGFRLMSNGSRFCLNLFAGGGLRMSDVNGVRKYDDFLQAGYTGIAPKVSFQLGIGF